MPALPSKFLASKSPFIKKLAFCLGCIIVLTLLPQAGNAQVVEPSDPAIAMPQAQDKTFTNSIGMEFLLIPAGKFTSSWTGKNDLG